MNRMSDKISMISEATGLPKQARKREEEVPYMQLNEAVESKHMNWNLHGMSSQACPRVCAECMASRATFLRPKVKVPKAER